MTPQTLLKETQRAAGNENLTTWHEALIKSGQELKELRAVRAHLFFSRPSHTSQRINSDKERLVTLKDRNATLEKEVKRFEERQALENKVRVFAVSDLLIYHLYADRKTFWKSSCLSWSTNLRWWNIATRKKNELVTRKD